MPKKYQKYYRRDIALRAFSQDFIKRLDYKYIQQRDNGHNEPISRNYVSARLRKIFTPTEMQRFHDKYITVQRKRITPVIQETEEMQEPSTHKRTLKLSVFGHTVFEVQLW